MSVSILLVTHGQVGQALLDAACKTLGELPLQAHAVSIGYQNDCENLSAELRRCAQLMDEGDGVLVLSDIFGATPCNLAQRIQDDESIEIVAGLNLPMLIRVMNYPDLDLLQLTHKALSGGRDGICCCSTENVAAAA